MPLRKLTWSRIQPFSFLTEVFMFSLFGLPRQFGDGRGPPTLSGTSQDISMRTMIRLQTAEAFAVLIVNM